MTDARFPERLLSDRRVMRLSADEYRGWSIATMWSVSNRTDGLILVDDLPLVPFMTAAIATKLEASGLWERTPDGWQIADFHRDQTSRSDLEVLERARKADRDKKARQRAQKKDSPGLSPGHVPGTAQEGQDRQGQDRQDRPRSTEESSAAKNTTEAVVTTWDTATIPTADRSTCSVCGERTYDSDLCSKQDDRHWAHEAAHAI